MTKTHLKVVDLFSGAGGFSEGFVQAGFKPVFANDCMPDATFTYSYNHPGVEVSGADIRKLETKKILKKIGIKRGDLEVITGGPPCQGFSLAGKRSIGDPRNALYRDFIRFVEAFQPKILVMENVLGLLSMKTVEGENVLDIISKEFESIGYKTTYKVLNSAEFGAPQSRRRVIFIANDLGMNNGVLFPKPTHGPVGGKPFVTVGDAIMDLADVKDPSDKFNHKPMSHSAKVLERLKLMPVSSDLSRDQSFLPKRLKRKAFAHNCKRLDLTKPSVTLVPGHYALPIHPTLPRTITVREAARLQGFPDRYTFFGKRDTQALLVGNAVPVPLARSLATRFSSFFN